MGLKTNLEKREEGLIIDIPKEFLPPKKIESPRVDETVQYVPMLVRKYGDRIALSLTYSEGVTPVDALSSLGFDPWQPVQVLLQRGNHWLNAHLFHGYRIDVGRRAYGRVWIPSDMVKHLRLEEYDVYPVKIRGWTPMRYVEERIYVEHFGRQYLTTEQGQWIPKKRFIPQYDILKKAKDLGIKVEGDFHKIDEDTVQVDFIIDKSNASLLCSHIGSAYRYMALRNYTSRDEGESAKYLLVELRATILTMYPMEYYQEGRHYDLLMEALRKTVSNMTTYFTQSIRHAEKIDRDYEKEHGEKPEPPKVEYETLGEENHVVVSPGETRMHPFYYVEKYVRITNEQSVRRKSGRNVRPMDRRLTQFFRITPATRAHIYDNDQIEGVLRTNSNVTIDKNGFVWLSKVY